MRVERLVLAQPVLDDGASGHSISTCFLDQQPIFGALRDDQQAQAQDGGIRAGSEHGPTGCERP